jgi:hypothetical protein
LGWVILAAALAVPGFLFYNWWSHQKKEHDRGLSARARTRVPDGGVFQTPPPGAVRPSPSVTASTAPVLAATAAVRASSSTAALIPTPAMKPPAALPPPVTARAQAMSKGLDPVARSTATAAIVLSRDPMMSPMDQVRLREAELEAERNADAIRRAAMERNRPRRKVVHREPPIETGLDLQGIVARPDGDNLAIVNGATVNPGESIVVEGFSGKVKVVRITSSEVTFEYKGRRIKKGVNAE